MNIFHIFTNGQRGQIGTISENRGVIILHGAAVSVENHMGKAGKTIKSVVWDIFDIASNGQCRIVAAAWKNWIILIPHSCATIRIEYDRGQPAAIAESVASDSWHRVSDSEWGQPAATAESVVADGWDSVPDNEWGQPAAIAESIVSNGWHYISDRERCKSAAIAESVVANG